MSDADSQEEWTQEDVNNFVEKMENEVREDRDNAPPPENPVMGVQLVGFMLFVMFIYGAYNQLHTFTLWIAGLMVLLALGNKAIR